MEKKSEEDFEEKELEGESEESNASKESRQGRGSPKAAEEERFVNEEMEEPERAEEPKNYFTSSPSDVYAGSHHSRSGKKIPFLLGIAVIIIILGGLFYFFKGRSETKKVEPSLSPVVVVEEPSPEPSPEFERSKHTLRVLNGTKREGLAASTSASLKELGYKIEKVANATNSAFLKTVVRVKSDLEELLENLKKELSSLDFEVEKGPELKDSDSSDGEVILGAE